MLLFMLNRDVTPCMELLKDLLVLALMTFMVKRNLQVGHVLFFSAVLFGLLHQVSPAALLINVYQSFTSASTLTVLAALFLISFLENTMRHSGSLNRLVSGLKSLSGGSRFAMAALPAIIGMLPSPGGARFSAPLVEEACRDIAMPGEQKAMINYWFRHVWEFMLPLYPANILAVQILQVTFGAFSLVMLPYSVLALLLGLLFLRHIPGSRDNKPEPGTARETWRQILEGLLPIAAIMLMVLLFSVHILAALLVVNAAYFLINILLGRLQAAFLRSMLKASFLPRLFYMVFGAIYLRDILVASGSIQQILDFAQGANLNPVILIALLAFVMSALTGLTITGVTVAMPMVLTAAGPGQLMGLASLAFAAAYIGLMVSPLHLCFLMSIEHFSANFAKTYRQVFLPLAVILVFACLYSYLLWL